MRVNEIFYSLQGEGFFTGVPSVFVRLSGCRLRCRWCDTKYAWDKTSGSDCSIDDILQEVDRYSSRFVVITGGEPMVKEKLPELLQSLKQSGKHITIETSGIAYFPDLPCDLMSISPKLSNSTPLESDLASIHENSRLDIAVLNKLIEDYEYQLKFVIDSESDLPEIRQTIEKLGTVAPEKVILMPQASTRQQLLAKSPMVADMCKSCGYVFGQRLHVLLWNNEKEPN